MRYLFVIMTSILLLMLVGGCSDRQSGLSQELASQQEDGLLEQLPALQPAIGEPREISDVQQRTGEMVFASSAGVSFNATTAQLKPGDGELHWVMYQFDTTVGPPQLQSVEVEAEFITGYYLAISNYETGRWQILGDYEDSVIENVSESGDSFTNGTHTYVALLSYDGDEAVIKSVSLSFPTPVSPDWVHSFGEQEDEFGTNYFEVLQGLATDSSGNVHALSTRVRGDEPSDNFAQLIRYDKDGNRTLAKVLRWPDRADFDDIVVDSSGNMYIVLVDSDLELIKLDSDAALIWARTYEMLGRGDQWRMRMDSDGNLLLSGTHDVFSEDDRGCVLKLDQDGNQIWGRQWFHAFFTPDVELAVLGTDVFVLDDNETASGFEAKYPMLVAFDKDANLIGSKVFTMESGEPLFGAFFSESITAGNGKVIIAGMAQTHIDGQFTTIHKMLSFDPDLTGLSWHSGTAGLPDIIGTQTLSCALDSNGGLHMLGITQNETFNLGYFASDGSFAGAWDITGTDTAKVLVESDYNHDRHRALLMMGPEGSIYAAGSTRDATGLSLVPGSLASHSIGGVMTDVTLDITELTITPTDVEGVQITDSNGSEDVPGDRDDTLVMRLTL